MPNFWSLSEEGVRFEKGVMSQMVTNTMPNYYSIATGLHTETHGIVDNVFLDPTDGEIYDYWNWTRVPGR